MQCKLAAYSPVQNGEPMFHHLLSYFLNTASTSLLRLYCSTGRPLQENFQCRCRLSGSIWKRWAKQALRGSAYCAHGTASSHTANGVHEHCEEVEVKCMAKSPKHVFCQILHVVDTTVVHRGKT